MVTILEVVFIFDKPLKNGLFIRWRISLREDTWVRLPHGSQFFRVVNYNKDLRYLLLVESHSLTEFFESVDGWVEVVSAAGTTNFPRLEVLVRTGLRHV